MEKRDNFSELIRKAAATELPVPSPDLERRVMIDIARRALARSRRKARRGMVASLAGLAMLLVGCIAALVVWYPVLIPTLTRFSWLKRLRIEIPMPEFSQTTTVPFLEEWGGLLLLVLLVGGTAGIIYYLNTLFYSDYTSE